MATINYSRKALLKRRSNDLHAVVSLTVSHTGEMIAVAHEGNHGSVVVWKVGAAANNRDSNEWEELRSYKHTRPITSIAFVGHNDEYIAVAEEHNNIGPDGDRALFKLVGRIQLLRVMKTAIQVVQDSASDFYPMSDVVVTMAAFPSNRAVFAALDATGRADVFFVQHEAPLEVPVAVKGSRMFHMGTINAPYYGESGRCMSITELDLVTTGKNLKKYYVALGFAMGPNGVTVNQLSIIRKGELSTEMPAVDFGMGASHGALTRETEGFKRTHRRGPRLKFWRDGDIGINVAVSAVSCFRASRHPSGGHILAAACSDKKIHIVRLFWEKTESGNGSYLAAEIIHTISQQEENVVSLALVSGSDSDSTGSGLILIGNGKGENNSKKVLKVWDVEKGTCLQDISFKESKNNRRNSKLNYSRLAVLPTTENIVASNLADDVDALVILELEKEDVTANLLFGHIKNAAKTS